MDEERAPDFRCSWQLPGPQKYVAACKDWGSISWVYPCKGSRRHTRHMLLGCRWAGNCQPLRAKELYISIDRGQAAPQLPAKFPAHLRDHGTSTPILIRGSVARSWLPKLFVVDQEQLYKASPQKSLPALPAGCEVGRPRHTLDSVFP